MNVTLEHVKSLNIEMSSKCHAKAVSGYIGLHVHVVYFQQTPVWLCSKTMDTILNSEVSHCFIIFTLARNICGILGQFNKI